MRTPTELRAKLAEAGEKMNSRNVKGGCRDYWERFAVKLRGVLGPPMLTEQEVCARLDGYIKRMERPFLKSSRIMFWASEAAYLQWILQPPEPVIDEAVEARAQAKCNKIGKSVYVWANAKGTYYGTQPSGKKCKMLIPEEKPPAPKKRPYVHVPKGIKGYTRKKDARTYAQRRAKAVEAKTP